MTQNAAILLLFFLSLFSCSEIKKPVAITEGDLEGYWVSGYLLHNTELSRSIASENSKKPKVLMLRLKNTVNGFADTSYLLKGNQLFYRTALPNLLRKETGGDLGEFHPFLITFLTKDRLVLQDIKTLEETTYYNINSMPDSDERFTEISFGFEILINDSFTFRKRKFANYKLINDSLVWQEEYYPNQSINETWRKDLDLLVKRINWKAALFLTTANKPQTKKIGEFKLLIPQGPRAHMRIETGKHEGEWRFTSQFVSDPALAVLCSEIRAYENYCYYNNFLLLTHGCGGGE